MDIKKNSILSFNVDRNKAVMHIFTIVVRIVDSKINAMHRCAGFCGLKPFRNENDSCRRTYFFNFGTRRAGSKVKYANNIYIES